MSGWLVWAVAPFALAAGVLVLAVGIALVCGWLRLVFGVGVDG